MTPETLDLTDRMQNDVTNIMASHLVMRDQQTLDLGVAVAALTECYGAGAKAMAEQLSQRLKEGIHSE